MIRWYFFAYALPDARFGNHFVILSGPSDAWPPETMNVIRDRIGEMVGESPADVVILSWQPLAECDVQGNPL